MQKSIYLGIDPTKNGLHLGHLYSIERTIRLCRSLDNRFILLIGSFTSRLGDPSDKKQPRDLLDYEEYNNNSIQIQEILKYRLSKIDSLILHNHEWLEKISFTEWIELFGGLSMNALIRVDFFKRRIDKSINLPLREFMYFSLQSYDFYYLNKNYNCFGQAGGIDQRNNIIRGIKLIKNSNTRGYLFPLIKDKDGRALSKTTMKDNLFSSSINTYLRIISMDDGVLSVSSQEEKHILAMQIVNLYYNKPFRIFYTKSFSIRDIITEIAIQFVISKNQVKKLIDEKSIIINIKNNRANVLYKKLNLFILNKS